MTRTKFDIKKFDGKNDFGLWQVRMKDMLEHQRLAASLEELPATIIVAYDNVIRKKAFNTLILCLGDWSYKRSSRRSNTTGIWKKLEIYT
uniref:Zinc finger, CCHC-type n=1 Tax=Tanacetum cinerariifolium TaxID=118510 RepID=A0A699TRY4_TANCI|nr:hypothetical protein [Tanacetum cinerariifolium]